MRRTLGILIAAGLLVTSPRADAQTYSYDDLGRLSTVIYADGSKVVYQYDAAGNRTAVTNIPPAPNAGNVLLSVPYNTAGSVTLTPTGVYSALSVVTAPAHGSASISGTTATFTPTAGYYGANSFTYRATGPGGNSPAATVSVTVGLPAAPVVSNKSLSAGYNTAGTVSLTPTGVYSSVAVVAAPGHGSASISGTTATYTPTTGYYGSDSFTYNATGPGGTSSTATVTVNVATPAAPTVSAKTLAVSYNTAGTVSLTPGGVYTSVTAATNPAHGSVSISGTTATYTPTTSYIGSDSFTYTATGPGGTSAAATVSVTVAAPAAPTVSNKALTVAYNTAGNVSLTPSGVYTSVATATNPAHGGVSISGTTATYTPTSGYYGSDSFTYTATGPGGTSSAATVAVTVSTPPAPTVSPATFTVAYNTAGTVSLNPSGVYTSVAAATNPAHGSVSISGSTATYTPTNGYYGADSFTYTATGPGGTSSAATVSVTVATPAAPTVSAKSLSVAYNTAGSVSLTPSGVYSSVATASNPGHGTVSISGTTATYTPTTGYYGSDSFTYTGSGPGGTSSPAAVSVTVGNPAAPTVGNVSSTVTYNTANQIGLAPSGVYSSLAVSSNPAHGSVSISGTTATYTPVTNYYGADSFTYSATGPGGTSGLATVSLNVVDPNNHAPTCTGYVVYPTSPGISVNPATFTFQNAGLINHCSDPDGHTLTVVSPSAPYTIQSYWNEPAQLTYTVTDGHGGFATGYATVLRGGN
ncbi:hypothetical protein MMA231_04024 (plasmid) [Asticcacaulis sp. MM231]|uniref:Ig-like domain-containing protein n=1 Tax=Asticcacaulis sp. MM231 TaxID=3157666 RepID=UPI0032D57F8C